MEENDSGFVSVGVMILMLVLAAVSLELSDRSGHRVNMAALNQESIQATLGCQATVEYGLWQVTNDQIWRTAAAGQDYDYAGTTYTLKVLDCTLSGYEDAIMITANAAGSTQTTGIGVRMGSPLIISDTENHRIRELNLYTGTIKTIAGSGTVGSSGNGGLATAARLNLPCDACMNSIGELYIADTSNHTVRKVNASGIITHVAGTQGTAGIAGDGGPAATAQLNSPQGVAVDAYDTLYIADTYNHAIRKVDTGTGDITTVVGILEKSGYVKDNVPAEGAKLDAPRSLVFDSAGNYFITDTGNNRIRRVDAVTKEITTYAGQNKSGSSGDGGPAIDATIIGPWGLALAPDDDLYFTEAYAQTVRRVDAEEPHNITTVAGVTWTKDYYGEDIAATSAWLDTPHGVCVTDDNDLIIADTYNSRIRRVDEATQNITTIAGTGIDGFAGDGGPGTNAWLNHPNGVNLGTPSLERVPELCR